MKGRAWMLGVCLVLAAADCTDEKRRLLETCDPLAEPCDEGACVCCDDDAALCCDGKSNVCADGDLSRTCRAPDGCPYDPDRGQFCDATTGLCVRPCTYDPGQGVCCNLDVGQCRGRKQVQATDASGNPVVDANGAPVMTETPAWCTPGEAGCRLVVTCLKTGTSRCMLPCDPQQPDCPYPGPAGRQKTCVHFPGVGTSLCTWTCDYDGACRDTNCGGLPDVGGGDRFCYPYFP